MKIRISVTETRYGYIDIDVPKNSPIFDPNASSLQKRRAARKLGETAVTDNNSCIIWPDPNVDDFYIPRLNVDLGYSIIDEEDNDT